MMGRRYEPPFRMEWGDPLRMAATYILVSGVAAQYSVASLFNDSTTGQILCPYDVTIDVQNNTGAINYFYIAQGLQGTVVVPTFSLFTIGANLSGKGYQGSRALNPVPLFAYTPLSYQGSNTHDFPLAFVTPCYSFALISTAQSTQIACTIYYEWRYQWEIPVVPAAAPGGD